MKLSARQIAILQGILCDLEHFGAMKPRYERDMKVVTERIRISEARDGLLRPNPGRWLGKPLTGSDYVLISRDYRRLEALGLIERHALGNDERRTTHLSLTKAGGDAAVQLRTATGTVSTERPV
jgi:hypothetical protein